MIFIDSATGNQIDEDSFDYTKGYVITTDHIPVEFKLIEDGIDSYYQVFDKDGNKINFVEYIKNDFGHPYELFSDDIQVAYVHFYNEEEQEIADKQIEKDNAAANFVIEAPDQMADLDNAVCELYEALLNNDLI